MSTLYQDNTDLFTDPADAPEITAASLHRPLVMVIEDDRSYRRLWRKIIVERLGMRCVDVENPVEAFRTFGDILPDLIVIDLYMPQMSGYTAVHRLKSHAQTRNIPIVVCTGSTQRDEVRRLAELGIAEYLVKPLLGNVVVERIQQILAPPPSQFAA